MSSAQVTRAPRLKQLHATFPPSLVNPLFHDEARYRVFYGGRGGAKSWSIARAILLKGSVAPLRVLCVREFMSSVQDSVHKLLSDQVYELGLGDRYTVERATIFCDNGTEIRFAGIRNNPQGLKSHEGTDICWAEEAQNISRHSWEILIPTIRRPDSEIWISFNPELATDETFQRFVVNPPPESVVTKINYLDNPYCPDVLHREADYMKAHDPDSYQHVWLGYPRVFLDNAVYAKELRIAQEEGRITKVPYDPLVPVHRFWDIGWADQTSIIMAQKVGFEYHVIDFMEGNRTTTTEFLRLLGQKKYNWGIDYLPHDAKAKSMGTGRSVEEIMRSQGCTVRIVPSLKINDGINAARTMFSNVWIDEVKCGDLMQSLRKYCYDITLAKPEPIHNESSHASDAFRYMALALRDPRPTFQMHRTPIIPRQTGWMG
jgi:phage terminase large subunit